MKQDMEKTTDILQVSAKFYHIKLYIVHLDIGSNRTLNLSGDRH